MNNNSYIVTADKLKQELSKQNAPAKSLAISSGRGLFLGLTVVAATWMVLILAYVVNVLIIPPHALKTSVGDSSAQLSGEGLIGISKGALLKSFTHKELTQSTNDERTKLGLVALSLNDKLNQSAQAKCVDMVQKGYWSHVSPDGTQPWWFFDNLGYTYDRSGENLAYGFMNSQDVINGWMNSPTHKANLVGDYVDVGFGICEGENYRNQGHQVVIVQHLGYPSAPKPTHTPAATYIPKPYVAPVCIKTPIPYETIYVDASYLYVGETNEYGGIDGYVERCTADSTGYQPMDFTSTPYNKTIYVGTKVREAPLP